MLGLGDPRNSGAPVVGRIRLRLRLVRPDTHHDASKKNAMMSPSGAAAGGAFSNGNAAMAMGGGNQLVALEQLPLEDELEGYFGMRCSFTRKDYHFWAGNGSNRRAWIKELQRVTKHAEEVYAHKKEQLALLEQHKSFEQQKNIVAKNQAEVEQQKRDVEIKKTEMLLKFELKELIDDLVARVEERIAEELPVRSDGGIDEKKVQELMVTMVTTVMNMATIMTITMMRCAITQRLTRTMIQLRKSVKPQDTCGAEMTIMAMIMVMKCATMKKHM